MVQEETHGKIVEEEKNQYRRLWIAVKYLQCLKMTARIAVKS